MNKLPNTTAHARADKLSSPGSFYQPLFDHMRQEHGLTLLESEMADIIHLVQKME